MARVKRKAKDIGNEIDSLAAPAPAGLVCVPVEDCIDNEH